MENKRGKSKQEYQEEIARLVETGKKLMTEAEEIISSHSQTRKASIAKTSTPQASHAPQGNGARFGLLGNLCALLMGHKLASRLFGDDKPRTDDYGSTSASDYDHATGGGYGNVPVGDFDHDMGDDYDPIEIDDYIEEEEDY